MSRYGQDPDKSGQAGHGTTYSSAHPEPVRHDNCRIIHGVPSLTHYR